MPRQPSRSPPSGPRALRSRCRERHVETGAPGEFLPAGTFFVGSLRGVGSVHLQAVVDTEPQPCLRLASHVSKQPEAAVAVRQSDVLPLLRSLDLLETAVLTNNGRDLPRSERHRAPPHKDEVA